MKKFILIIPILCVGCNMVQSEPREDKIVKETVECKTVIQETNLSEKEYQGEIKITENNKDNIENVIDATKTWYDENKDELKEISKEIIENDKENIENVIDATKTWYYENKDELKEISKEIIENDKTTVSDLYNKIKNIE